MCCGNFQKFTHLFSVMGEYFFSLVVSGLAKRGRTHYTTPGALPGSTVVPGHSNSRPATGQPARPAQVQYLVPYHSLTQSGSIPAVAVPTGTVPVLYTSKNQQYFLAVMAV